VSKRLRIGGLLIAFLAMGLLAGVAAGDGCEDQSNPNVTTHVVTLTNTLTMRQTTASRAAIAKAEQQAADAAKAGHEAQTAGGGGNEGVRIPAAFAVSASGLDPAPITVPPGVSIVLVLTSKDGAAHTVAFDTSPAVTLKVAAQGSVVRSIPGQEQGTYRVRVDGGPPRVALVALNDAGP